MKQHLAESEQSVRNFWATLVGDDKKCVIKPNNSAGSDSVFLCENEDQAINAFNTIDGHVNGLGATNHGALCQEFLQGTEFVVDGVSRDGKYKVDPNPNPNPTPNPNSNPTPNPNANPNPNPNPNSDLNR